METKSNTMWLIAQTHLWGAMINSQAFVYLPHPDSRAWIWSYKNRHKHNLRPNFTALPCKRLQNILDTRCAWLVSPAASPGCCPRHTHTQEWEAYVQAGSWPQYLTNLWLASLYCFRKWFYYLPAEVSRLQLLFCCSASCWRISLQLHFPNKTTT